MITARIRIQEPDSADATLTITMPIKQWKELKGQLSDSYPSWKLGSAIGSLVRQVERVFEERDIEL